MYRSVQEQEPFPWQYKYRALLHVATVMLGMTAFAVELSGGQGSLEDENSRHPWVWYKAMTDVSAGQWLLCLAETTPQPMGGSGRRSAVVAQLWAAFIACPESSASLNGEF